METVERCKRCGEPATVDVKDMNRRASGIYCSMECFRAELDLRTPFPGIPRSTESPTPHSKSQTNESI